MYRARDNPLSTAVVPGSGSSELISIGLYTPWESDQDDFLSAFDQYFASKSDPRMGHVAQSLSELDFVTETDVKYFRPDFTNTKSRLAGCGFHPRASWWNWIERNSIHIFDAIFRLEFILNRISSNVYQTRYWRQIEYSPTSHLSTAQKEPFDKLYYCILPQLNSADESAISLDHILSKNRPFRWYDEKFI